MSEATDSTAARVAVVTGATGGIGRAIACALAERGARVVVGYHKAAERARAVVDEIRARSGEGRAIACAADLRSPKEALKLGQAALGAFGRVDIVVHCAGVAQAKLLLDTTPAEWREMLGTHVDGAFYLLRGVLPALWRQRWGRVIFISSVWGLYGAAGEVAYSTAKAALIGFAKALAREVGPAGITVNAVAPGPIQTAMLEGYTPAELDEMKARTPLGRLGTPADVVSAVLFLASEAAGYVTGEVIEVSGGFGR
ncbi:MAG TPA: 3-oxoacyl-ACP reductase family protein [Limnochordia bacterium]